ncbi:hypothetical protein M3589_22210 [Heyndrickxia oleronia]|uniref:hypothetical protein n=1 Tax=Heyndrickxia oleronia TaxID=38875 RepID=UPI0020408002|nr:hypothetical protein [Heyndrickxia oleronia]MCM3240388.1 hypothetical protein [Heyndrickxia oleronia]
MDYINGFIMNIAKNSFFDVFYEAKKQVMDAVLFEDATQKHWCSIPHTSIYFSERNIEELIENS